MGKVETEISQELDGVLGDWQAAAKAENDLVSYLFCSRVKTELAHLRAVGILAARIYQDHSDESAWDELFEALSVAGLLPDE